MPNVDIVQFIGENFELPAAQPEIVIGPVPELSTFKYTAILSQGNGQPIPNGSLVTITLTITDDLSGAIINSRQGTNVLNLNGVTVDVISNPATGNLVWEPDSADNPWVNNLPNQEDGALENHTAVFIYTWSLDGVRTLQGKRIVHIQIKKVASTEIPIEIGTGPNNVSIYIDDGTGNPNPGVDVWVTSDADGLVRAAGTLVTNQFGKVLFHLTAGNTYYLWTNKVGFTPMKGVAFVAVVDT